MARRTFGAMLKTEGTTPMTNDTPTTGTIRSTQFALLALFLATALGADTAAARDVGAPHRPPVETAATSTAVDTVAAIRKGRRLTGWLMGGHADSIVAVTDSAYLQRIGGTSGVASLAGKVGSQLGSEQEVVAEEVFTDRNVNHYYRVSRFSGAPARTITTRWGWRDDGTVILVGVRPTPRPADTGNGEYTTRADLRLPFDGSWYVFWGGRTPRLNYHAQARDQRFAYDFLKLVDGSSHEDDGSENADYHCYGTPVLAPAAGRVVRMADSVPDNTPGRMNREQIFGNHVVLDHGDGEYSVLAHLRHGSVAVDSGDRVERGERLGECGNSGNSSEPHLHYHLQDGPALGRATGLPAFFRSYTADGDIVERGEPTRGQVVRPAGGA
ncbi:MAG: M23 family metallopeptidase [Candidatus Palauibacterales bacterium]|nr:M23 family metallopeptidase [Candidatus Palauibacterales bacterium]